MIKYIAIFFLLSINNLALSAQDGHYGLSFANEQTNGNTLCVDIELRFKNGGKLGSSNLVMKYNKVKLAKPIFSSSTLPMANYATATVTNPVDSLAAFNIELLTENNGITIATAPAKTVLGQLCFDVLNGVGASCIDWQIRNTAATVVFLDDETTQLKRGRIDVLCTNVGLACDDGDPNTTNDKYDINCLCAGTQMDCVDDTAVNQAAIPARIYKSRMKINSQGKIRPNARVDFRAAQSITLGVGFHAEEGSEFTAMIESCTDNVVEEVVQNRISEEKLSPVLETTTIRDVSFSVFPNPISSTATLTYVLPKEERVKVELFSLRGRLVQTLFSGKQNKGMHLMEWQTNDLPLGMYFMRLQTADGSVLKKVVVQ